jgi:hypothetical protein
MNAEQVIAGAWGPFVGTITPLAWRGWRKRLKVGNSGEIQNISGQSIQYDYPASSVGKYKQEWVNTPHDGLQLQGSAGRPIPRLRLYKMVDKVHRLHQW